MSQIWMLLFCWQNWCSVLKLSEEELTTDQPWMWSVCGLRSSNYPQRVSHRVPSMRSPTLETCCRRSFLHEMLTQCYWCTMKRYIYIMLYNEECFYSPARLALSPDFIQKQRERSSTKVSIANRTDPVPSKNRLGRMQAFAKLRVSSRREREFFSLSRSRSCACCLGVAHKDQRSSLQCS